MIGKYLAILAFFAIGTSNGYILDDLKSPKSVVDLAISLAKQGLADEAQYQLRKLDNYTTFLPSIVSQIYTGDMTSVKNTIGIFEGTPCETFADGMEILYNEIKTADKLTDPQVIMIDQAVKTVRCILDLKLENTSRLLKPHVENILNRWADNILKQNYTEIYSFEEDAGALSILNQLPILLRKVFSSNPDSFNKSLEFINGFTFLATEIEGYTSLFEELKLQEKTYSKDMFLVSYWLYIIGLANKASLENSYLLERVYENVTKSIPEEIKNVLWKQTCSIKNVVYKEPLYATGDGVGTGLEIGKAAGENEGVFTWIPKSNLSSAEWALIPRYLNGSVYFHVRNRYFSNDRLFLCSGCETGKMTACSDDDEGTREWYLNPVIRNGTVVFTIKNSEYDKVQDFLQAEGKVDESKKRRTVSTAGIGDSSYWKIDCY